MSKDTDIDYIHVFVLRSAPKKGAKIPGSKYFYRWGYE